MVVFAIEKFDNQDIIRHVTHIRHVTRREYFLFGCSTIRHVVQSEVIFRQHFYNYVTRLIQIMII